MKLNLKLFAPSGVIPIAIKIGTVIPIRFENWDVVPDDRQTRFETIGGVEVQDFGHVEEGDTITCDVTLRGADAGIIFNYWHNRTLVNVEDEGGTVYENMRVVVKRYTRIKYFQQYFEAKLEFWRK